MKGKIGDKQRLEHIRDAIIEVQDYTKDVDKKTFLNNSMMRFASIKQLEIVGEASNYITSETKILFTEIEWGKMIGMRHILVHEYFGTDIDIVWEVITNDISHLKGKVIQILNEWTEQ